MELTFTIRPHPVRLPREVAAEVDRRTELQQRALAGQEPRFRESVFRGQAASSAPVVAVAMAPITIG